jgi:hypothetical protein
LLLTTSWRTCDYDRVKAFKKYFLKRQRSVVYRLLRFFCVLIVMLAVVAPFPLTQSVSATFGKLITAVTQPVSRLTTSPQGPSTAQAPERTQVTRLKVLIGETRDVPLAMQLSSILVVSSEIASAVLNSRGLTITGLHVGETMLIAFDKAGRHTFVVEVMGRTQANSHPNKPTAESVAFDKSDFSGSYSITYSAPFAGTLTAFRQSFEFQKKLTVGRTLRFSSDMFKFMGEGNQDSARATAFRFGLNRMSLGIDGPDGSLDILDSQINVSPLSFNGYTMRGFHVVSTRASRLRGMEIFAGLARPSLLFFDQNQGRVMGVVMPLAQGEFWRVRAGMFSVSPAQNNKLGRGGTVWHLDGRYAPSKNLAAEGEVAYANAGLSWRARLDLQTKTLSASGEILRFDRGSPLVSIGAQGGGRETEAFAFHWRAGARLNTSLSYNHTAIVPPATALRATLDRTTLSANANYRLNHNSRLGFRFVQQQIETRTPRGDSRFRLETRTISVSHDIRFNKSWTNNLIARLNSSREPLSGRGTESGVIVNEQLRYSFKRGSAVGFVNYTRQQQSLAGLIVRNPRLLPPLLQGAFTADPARFLEQNRNSLNLLLPGVELPQTRGLDAGVRLQAAFSRVNLAGELRYSAGEILARTQRSLLTSASMNMRLDAANSLQVTGSRSFGANGSGGQSALTISYVHRFGAGSGGGFQFSRMLGLERGQIQGRVFFDLNGNGQDDTNEPGIARMKVQTDGGRSATTDEGGHFRLQINSGDYRVAFVSEELGVRWRATTMTEQHGFLSARQTVNVSFGVTNYGSVAGRVFNDVLQKGEPTAGSLPGVAGVRLSLRPTSGAGASLSLTVDASGVYQFRNVTPGGYTLEIDPATLPADFRLPRQTSWGLTVEPLQNFYLDVPLAAQHAVSGVVFVDKDGDGKFDPQKDEAVEGARVITGRTEVTTGKGGSYILRALPAGRMEVRAVSPWGTESRPLTIEFGAEPATRRAVHLAVATKKTVEGGK